MGIFEHTNPILKHTQISRKMGCICKCTKCILHLLLAIVNIGIFLVYEGLCISAAISASNDELALTIPDGKTYFKTLPIVSCIIPNPITTYITGYGSDCEKYRNCDAEYIKQTQAAFYLSIVLWFGSCILSLVMCCFEKVCKCFCPCID